MYAEAFVRESSFPFFPSFSSTLPSPITNQGCKTEEKWRELLRGQIFRPEANSRAEGSRR